MKQNDEQHPPHALSAASKVIKIGHRGAPGYRPEHTKSSYQLAMLQNVDAIEPDLVLTKDGKLVIRHENEISTTTNIAEQKQFADRRTTKLVDGHTLTGWFTEDFTLKELKTLKCIERLPTIRPKNTQYNNLDEILTLAELNTIITQHKNTTGKDISLILEIKHVDYYQRLGYDYIEILIKEIKSLHLEETKNLTIECFELSALEELQQNNIDAEFIFLLENDGYPADEQNMLTKNSYEWYRSDEGLKYLKSKVSGISVNKTSILNSKVNFVRQAKDLGLRVYTWTLRPENYFLEKEQRTTDGPHSFGEWRIEWDKILDSGVDGVFLDHPDLLT